MTVCHQISQYARYHFEKLFSMLSLFQSHVRPKRENGRQSASAAMHLGKLFSCLQNLHLALKSWRHADISTIELYPGLTSALRDVKFIGFGLSQESFEEGRIKEPLPTSCFHICVLHLPQKKCRISDGPTGDDCTFAEAIQSLSRQKKMKTLHLEDFGVQVILPKRVSGKVHEGSTQENDINDGLFALECLRQQLEYWQKTAAPTIVADSVSLRSTNSLQGRISLDEDRTTAVRSPSFSSSGTNMIDGFPPRTRVADDDLYHEFVRSEACKSSSTATPSSVDDPSIEPPQFVAMQDVEFSHPSKPSSVNKIFRLPGTKRKACLTLPSHGQKLPARKNLPRGYSDRGTFDTAMTYGEASDKHMRAVATIQGPRLNAHAQSGTTLAHFLPEPPYDPLFQTGQTTNRPSSYPQSRKWRKSVGKAVKAIRDGFGDMELNKNQQQNVKDMLMQNGLGV